MKRIAGALIGCVLAGCAKTDTPQQDRTAASPTMDSAVASVIGDTVEDTMRVDTASNPPARAVMHDSAGRELGVLTLTTTPGGITIQGRLTGVEPGEHGLHVHTVGRCDPPFESAGGHWNPTNRHHGEQNPAGGPHVGDLLNVTVPANGIVDISQTTHGGSLHGEVRLMDADGGSIVMHRGKDDYRSDPSGNSGPRVACGVVGPP